MGSHLALTAVRLRYREAWGLFGVCRGAGVPTFGCGCIDSGVDQVHRCQFW